MPLARSCHKEAPGRPFPRAAILFLNLTENQLHMVQSSSSVRRRSVSVTGWALGLGLVLVAVGSCAKGDVGAPCNHGDVEPPETKLVTFPALSCNDLLCVYADDAEAIETPCADDLACNTDPAQQRFECVFGDEGEQGTCRLRIDYVLQRSMCSKKCSSDDDCRDGGITDQVVADNTNCETGFVCARIQTLGKFCCEKLCVCNDDLGVNDIDEKCSASTQEGCCVTPEGEPASPLPPACGKP
jgi:hypothetical protein